MKSIFLLILSVMSASCFSQRISGYVAGGLGSSIEKNIEGCTDQNRIRYIGSMAAYFKINGRMSMGAEAIGSGALNIFGGSSCDIGDPVKNTLTLSPSNMKAGTILLRNQISLFSYKEMEPYIGIGAGINTYYYSDPGNGVGSIRKTSFVWSPEFGINMYKFQFACKVIIGGKTPSFTGSDPEGSRTVMLESIKANQVYLTIGYQLFRF